MTPQNSQTNTRNRSPSLTPPPLLHRQITAPPSINPSIHETPSLSRRSPTPPRTTHTLRPPIALATEVDRLFAQQGYSTGATTNPFINPSPITPQPQHLDDDISSDLPPLLRPLPNPVIRQEISPQLRIRIVHNALRVVPDLLNCVRNSYHTETETLTPIVALVIQDTLVNSHWTIFDGIAWRDGRIYVGEDLRPQIISWCHLADLISDEHLDLYPTLWILQALFYWDTLETDLRSYFRSCHCQTAIPVTRVTSTQQ